MARIIVLACALVLTVGTANANTVISFDVAGTFDNPAVTMYHPPSALTGTLTVDVTTGLVTETNLAVPGFSAFSNILHSYEFFAGLWTMTIANASGSVLDFTFAPSPLPSPAPVTGSGQLFDLLAGTILGGELYVACVEGSAGCQSWPNWPGNFAEYFGGNSLRGTLTADLAETPLPAALPLFGSGLGAMGLLGWLRRRRSASPVTRTGLVDALSSAETSPTDRGWPRATSPS